MAYQYLIQQNTSDSHQAHPWALILVIRFAIPNTFEYPSAAEAFKAVNQKSAQVNDAVKYDKILIRSDILSVSVQSDKNSFTGGASAVLVPGQYDYQHVIFPGDHAFIWMNNDISELQSVVNAISSGGFGANSFTSGLKFYGRVDSVRKIFTTFPDGKKSIRYNINFKSFSEFNSQIYFNPYLGNANNDPLLFYSQISREFNELFVNGRITPSSAIKQFMSIFLGDGPGGNSKQVGTIQRSPNNAYIIPRAVGEVFGQLNNSKGSQLTYSDIVNMVLGIQEYNDANSQLTTANTIYSPFVPLLKQDTLTKRQRECAKELQGIFLSVPDNFNNIPLWSLMQSFLNTALNEMYLTLRTDENGNILPTLIARQIPFSTPKMADNKNITNTQFTNLPRWKIDNSRRIGSYNIGTSDSMRINFVQFYGQIFNSQINTVAALANQSGPENVKQDRLDILRSGSRNALVTSNVSALVDDKTTVQDNINNYSQLISDWYINGHLKLTGSMTLAGVKEPICIGDNLEYDNKIFHIEAISHEYRVDGINKTFITSLNLSNGMNTDGTFISNNDISQASIQQNVSEPYNTTNEIQNPSNDKPILNASQAPSVQDVVKSLVKGISTNDINNLIPKV